MELNMEKRKNKAVFEKTGALITRRRFLGFFLFGGVLSLFSQKANTVLKQEPKKAMFWRSLK